MRSFAAAFAAIWLAATGIATAQDVVGVAKRVRGAAELLAAQGRDKLLAPGDRIRVNDVVKTGANGSALLQLADATVFTIGANAEIKIDRFVYDPAAADRAVAQATILQGALRFISGRISKENPGGLEIKAPVGTIGIRGTIAVVDAGADGTTVVLLDPQSAPPGGALVVRTPAGEARLSKAGEGLVLREGGGPPQVREWSEDEVNALLGRAGGGVWVKPQAAAAPSQTPTRLSRAECAALERDALDGAEYRPGVDSRGAAVAPADLGGAAAQPDFAITLTLDVLKAAGIDTRAAGLEGNATLGDIRIEGGRAYLGGALLDPNGTDALRRLCRRNFGR